MKDRANSVPVASSWIDGELWQSSIYSSAATFSSFEMLS